jgi:hypothetical protein
VFHRAIDTTADASGTVTVGTQATSITSVLVQRRLP